MRYVLLLLLQQRDPMLEALEDVQRRATPALATCRTNVRAAEALEKSKPAEAQRRANAAQPRFETNSTWS